MSKESVAKTMSQSQLLDLIQRQKDARECEAFLQDKVDHARCQIAAGQYASAEEVEARFAARRALVRG